VVFVQDSLDDVETELYWQTHERVPRWQLSCREGVDLRWSGHCGRLDFMRCSRVDRRLYGGTEESRQVDVGQHRARSAGVAALMLFWV